MELLHVSITARNADRLSAFYRDVFGLLDLRQPKHLSGELVSLGNGLAGSEIYSIWLGMPGREGPFLEIFEYSHTLSRRLPQVNEPGFGHLAFGVQSIADTIDKVLEFGGTLQGQTVNLGTKDKPSLVVYVRDIEGNILELEQRSNG